MKFGKISVSCVAYFIRDAKLFFLFRGEVYHCARDLSQLYHFEYVTCRFLLIHRRKKRRRSKRVRRNSPLWQKNLTNFPSINFTDYSRSSETCISISSISLAHLTFHAIRVKKYRHHALHRGFIVQESRWEAHCARRSIPVKAWLTTPVAFCIRPVTPGINLRGLLSAAMKIEGVWPELPRDHRSIFAPRRAVSQRISRGFTDP